MNYKKFSKFSESQTQRLLSEPETGMGYQILEEINLSPNAKKDINSIVSNSEIFIQDSFKNNYSSPVIIDFQNLEFDFAKVADSIFFEKIGNNIIVSENSKYSNYETNSQLPQFGYKTKNGDEFRRLSAFKNDRRVQDDGSLFPKSYGTSISDLTIVPSGTAAVGRYALPNKLAACYVYQIIPPPGTEILFGTVTPNFGLCGGGVEIYFPYGCPKGSVKLIGTIPEI